MNSQDILNRYEWRELIEMIPVVKEFFGGDQDSHGLNGLLHGLDVYIKQMLAAVDAGKPFVWYNLGFNSELIWALQDVMPITVEAIGALHSALCNSRITKEFIDEAQAVGIPADSCSADKLSIGAIRRGLYPKPACTVGINTPCDAQVLCTQVYAELGEAPFFPIDVPYYHNEETIHHVAGQLKDLIPFLEENTGRKMDIDKLREACHFSNQTSEYLWEWLDWRK